MVLVCEEGFLWCYEAFEFQLKILNCVCENDDDCGMVGTGKLGF